MNVPGRRASALSLARAAHRPVRAAGRRHVVPGRRSQRFDEHRLHQVRVYVVTARSLLIRFLADAVHTPARKAARRRAHARPADTHYPLLRRAADRSALAQRANEGADALDALLVHDADGLRTYDGDVGRAAQEVDVAFCP